MTSGGRAGEEEKGPDIRMSEYLRRLDAVKLPQSPSSPPAAPESRKQDAFAQVRGRIETEMGLPGPSFKVPEVPIFRAPPTQYSASARRAAWFRPAVYLPLLTLALTGGLMYARRPAPTKDHFHQLASSNISGISLRAGELWAGDWVTGTIYRYSCPAGDPVLLESYPLGSTHITSMSIAGDRAYIWDSWAGLLHVRSLEPGLPPILSARLSKKLTSIHYDGKVLWTCDEDGSLSRRAPDPPLAELDAYKLEEHPQLVFLDGPVLWTSDANGTFYRRTLAGGLSAPSRHNVPNLNRKYPVSAFAWHDGRLWLAMDGKMEVAELGSDSLIPAK